MADFEKERISVPMTLFLEKTGKYLKKTVFYIYIYMIRLNYNYLLFIAKEQKQEVR